MTGPSRGLEPEALRRLLAADELVLGSVRARLPRPGTSTNTFGSVWAFILVADRAMLSRRVETMVDGMRAAGFPFASRMILVATSERLLVLEAVGRAWSPGQEVGEVARRDVVSFTLPYLGEPPWKVARLDLASGARAHLLIERDGAEGFVAHFA